MQGVCPDITTDVWVFRTTTLSECACIHYISLLLKHSQLRETTHITSDSFLDGRPEVRQRHNNTFSLKVSLPLSLSFGWNDSVALVARLCYIVVPTNELDLLVCVCCGSYFQSDPGTTPAQQLLFLEGKSVIACKVLCSKFCCN